MYSIHFSSRARVLFLPVILILVMGIILCAEPARPAHGEDDTIAINTLEISGVLNTKEDTIRRLLPRPIPSPFTRAEVEEFERRIRNLSLFDRVKVTTYAGTMAVDVREKFTLSPILSFTSGTSAKDLNATAGLVEYNLGGTGTQIGGQFNYSQRGPNVDVWISEHAYRPDRWAKEVKGSYSSNGIRFADSTATWTRNRIGGEFELKGPFSYGSPLRFEVVAKIYRELVQDQARTGTRPPDGYYVGLIPEVTWDRYHWHDLVPMVSHRAGTPTGVLLRRRPTSSRGAASVSPGNTRDPHDSLDGQCGWRGGKQQSQSKPQCIVGEYCGSQRALR